MRNRFLKTYDLKTISYLDKNKFKSYIDNYTNPSFLATYKIKKLQSDIRNSYRNNPKKLIKRNEFLSKVLSKNYKLKPNIQIETNIINNKHFIREFEDLFEKTTNNNIVDYFFGLKVEKMNDLAKRIKEFNYSSFMKKFKRKRSKNKKVYNNLRNLSAQTYNKDCSYKGLSCRTSPNKNNCSDVYSNTTYTTIGNLEENKINFRKTLNNFKYDINYYTKFRPLKKELNFNFEKIEDKSLQVNKNPSHYTNIIERLKLSKDTIKYRNFSYNSKVNKNNIDNLFYHYKTQKYLNLNFI